MRTPPEAYRLAWFLFRRGLSYREIGLDLKAAFGRPFNRNMVAGILHRVRINEARRTQLNKEFENVIQANP